MTTITNDTNAVSLLRPLTTESKIELLSKYMGVNLNDVLAEETERRRLEGEAERLRQEEELKRNLDRKLKAQREFIKQGFLSGQILAITPKRKLWSDVDLLSDGDCFKIKKACETVRNMNSFPIFAQEVTITVEDTDLLVICRKSA